MSKKKFEQYDDMEKLEKFRRPKKGKSSKSSDLVSSFEITKEEWCEKLEEDMFYARVVEVHKRYAFISPEPVIGDIKTKDVWISTVAKKYLQAARKERNFICVGDRVLCRIGSGGLTDVSEDLPQATIEYRLKRSSKIARLDPMTPEREHVLASNITQMVIVASYLHPTVKWGLIDRYLILAESQGIKPVIILNKKDLLKAKDKKEFAKECKEKRKAYKDLGYEVLSFSIDVNNPKEQKGLKSLNKIFQGEISLVSGHSGVGKSSIINLMTPEIIQDVEEDSIFYKGRHTTTYASLLLLGNKGFVVDTPGIRSFAIEERTAVELSWCFREMRGLIGKCKYRECRHVDEPDCAVLKAVEDGDILTWRYNSYLAILTGATGREGRLRGIEV